ncbi:MAG: leucine-rich repeat domain-containing protein, partial [Sedimentisphaerales bacterium]|nr:leucine-rich repeat domain-containing protein [Sedimentisphaerales bacterium]
MCRKITVLTMLILFMSASTGLAYDTVLLRAGSLLNCQAFVALDPAPVYFADANLKAAVEVELGVDDPNASDMLNLTYLNGNYLTISDLTGLEYGTNLTDLQLYGNQIIDISALSGLTNLTLLYLSENQISNISALAGMTNLTDLDLYDNQISDISALAGLKNLSRLWLDENQINDIFVLSGLTNLTNLYLTDNQISDISALSEQVNLNRLWLQNNNLNIAAYAIYLSQIEENNPGIDLRYDSVDDWNGADYAEAGRKYLFDRTLTGIRNAYLIFDYGISQVGTGNRDLVFLHALTRAMMLVVEDGQTEMTSLFELAVEYGIDIVGDSLEDPGLEAKPVLNSNGHYEIPSGARDEDGIRDLLDNFTIPEIEAILAELELIGDAAGDRFRIFFTTQETGLKDQLEVDFGDVLILKAFLEMVKSQMRQSDAYDLEVDDPNRIIGEIYGDSFSVNDDLLIPYPDLLKVQPTAGQPGNGAAALVQARQDLLDGIDRFFEAVDYLRNEEDDQLDDLIYIDSRAEDKLERIEEKLADLQDSLENDHAITHATETTRNYLLEDYEQQYQINLSLVFDPLDNLDSDQGELTVVGSPGRWIVEEAEIDEWDLFVMFRSEEEDSADGGTLLGTINKEMNAITGAVFEYWGSQSDVIYDLKGQLIATEKTEKQLDLNPIYGSVRYPEPVNPRDLLPEFDLWNGPLPGTMGQGLQSGFMGLTGSTPVLPGSGPATDGPAQLGGILPSVADQEEWIREINMQPGGRISLYMLGETDEIELNGQLDEWHLEQLIFTDIADDTEEPNLVSGCDIENFYLTLSEDGSMLYGAITTHDIIDSGSADYKLRYKFFLSYIPRSRESLNSYMFIIKADETTGTIYRYEDAEWYGEWMEISTFNVSVGQRSVEFAIPIDDPEISLPGRFISLDSSVFDNNNETEETGDKNNTHLQIAYYGAESVLDNISGNVVYADYQDGPIVVQAYGDYDDPEDSLVASTVLHNGPGAFVLEGIGQNWSGYVRAFAPVTGANYFGWEGDNDLISNVEEVEMIDGDQYLGEDLVINPWHDFCEYAVILEVGVPFSGSAYNATGEDITDNCINDEEDVWHSFTPDIDGVYRVQCNTEFYPCLSVFDGCGGDMLAFSSSENNEVYFNAIAGETYLIRLSSEYYEMGDYEIGVYYYDVPLENDFCDQAVPLVPDLYVPGMFTITGDTLGATGTDGTPEGYCDSCDVWNSFIVPQDGVYELHGQVSGNSTVAIYDACGGNQIAFQQTYYDINLRFHGVEGKTYLIRVAGEWNTRIFYDLSIVYGWAAPANDLCADANEIFLDDPLVGNTALATGDDLSSCGEDDSLDLWYEFTPESDALYRIDIANISAEVIILSVFEECGGEEILCREDDFAYFSGQAGENYLIRVASSGQNGGEFVITVSQSGNPSVPNDDWRNALPIEEGDSVESTTEGATGEDLTSCGVDDNMDVWYLFAPTRNGEFTIYLSSNTEGSTVAVFKYDWPLWLAGLGEVECLNEYWENTMYFEGRTDELYLIRVAGQYNQYVNYYLSLNGPEVGWYTLNTDVIGNGTIQPSSGKYYEGEEVPLEATPAEGWRFVEWQGDASGTDPNILIYMDSDKEVTAVFEEDYVPPTFYDLTV